MTLAWQQHGQGFAIATRTFPNSLTNIVELNARAPSDPRRVVTGWPQRPAPDELTTALRIVMEIAKRRAYAA